MTKIFRYVIRHDGGSAPRPYGDVCSLAICKPAIRKTATKGDWIIGFRSGCRDQVVYVMQVSEVLTFEKYWERYPDRRPNASPVPDNIYRPNGYGELMQVENPVHFADQTVRDLSGRNVLLAHRFWYFGRESKKLDDELNHLKPYCRGHSVHINRQSNDEERLENRLKSCRIGIEGTPIDVDDDLLRWLGSAHGDDTGIDSAASSGGCSSPVKKDCALPCTPKSKCG